MLPLHYRITDINRFHVKGGAMMDMYGCCGTGRGFLTKEEKIEMLKEYRESLEKEAKGVAERIRELERS